MESIASSKRTGNDGAKFDMDLPAKMASPLLVPKTRKLSKTGVAVEKLFRPKIAKTKLRQDAL